MNLENHQRRRRAGLAKDDQRILLAVALLSGLVPVCTGWWKDPERIDRLDERQMPGMADAAAMRGTAAMRVGRSDPRSLG